MKRLAPYRGYLTALFAYLMYSSMDSCVKLLGNVPAFQVVTVTYTVTLISALIFFRGQLGRWQFLPVAPAHRFWLGLRGILFFSVSALAFIGLKQVSLPSFYAVFFTSPLLVTILAAFWLREQVRWPQWVFLLLGFAGVLIVFRPWDAAWQPGLIFVALAALVHASSNVVARRLCQHVPAATSLVWTLAVGTALALLSAVPGWQALSIVQWELLLSAGFFTVLANLAFIYAIYQVGAAPLAITHYSQIIWGILFGFIFWGTLPDKVTFAGTALIITAGICMMRYQANQTELAPIV